MEQQRSDLVRTLLESHRKRDPRRYIECDRCHVHEIPGLAKKVGPVWLCSDCYDWTSEEVADAF